MGVVVTTTVGLMIWVVLWAMGVKGFDAFLITLTLVLIAAMGRILAASQPGDER
jgi:hypothetical protein